MNIEKNVIEMLASITNKSEESITIETRLAQDLMIKSVNRIELAAILETKFKVPINNFDILKPKTVQEIVVMIRSKMVGANDETS